MPDQYLQWRRGTSSLLHRYRSRSLKNRPRHLRLRRRRPHSQNRRRLHRQNQQRLLNQNRSTSLARRRRLNRHRPEIDRLRRDQSREVPRGQRRHRVQEARPRALDQRSPRRRLSLRRVRTTSLRRRTLRGVLHHRDLHLSRKGLQRHLRAQRLEIRGPDHLARQPLALVQTFRNLPHRLRSRRRCVND